jgi:hypothetical protein
VKWAPAGVAVEANDERELAMRLASPILPRPMPHSLRNHLREV